MPELPEVENVVRTLHPRLADQPIRGVTLHRDDFATPSDFDWQSLVGRRFVRVTRRAKRIVIELCNGDRLLAGLGMTGRLTFTKDPAQPLAKHTHVVFHTGGGELRFCDPRRFGYLTWIGDAPHDVGLGPEPLDLPAAGLARLLQTTGRPIKSALLDQALIAGLGNIYADEALFAAGIHPLTPCRDVDRDAAARLSRAIKRTLREAIDAGGSTLRDYVDGDGKAGGFQLLHRVYGREAEPCHKCRGEVIRIVLTGRSTHFCPACQPAA